MATLASVLLAPEAHLVGSDLGGIAQGGGSAALFTVVVRVSRNDRESARLSAFVQGIGYVIADTFSTLGVAAGLTQSRQHPSDD